MPLPELRVERSDWEPERGHRSYAPEQPDPLGEVLLRTDDGILGASLTVPLDDDLDYLARALRMDLHFDDGATGTSQARASGIRYDSKVFGFTDPKPLRKRYGATVARLHVQYPILSGALERLTRRMWDLFVTVNPVEAERHEAIVRAAVHPDWLFAGVPFTSGIINKTARLPYHLDRGNLAGTWSAMLALRGDMAGGGSPSAAVRRRFGNPRPQRDLVQRSAGLARRDAAGAQGPEGLSLHPRVVRKERVPGVRVDG